MALHRTRPTPERFDRRYLFRLVPEGKLANSNGAIVASVVPSLDLQVNRILTDCMGFRPHFVSYLTPSGIGFEVDDPRQLGADRIAAVAGALTIFSPPLLVIDSGTATTFDLVDRYRHYIGGSILPGIHISLRSLADHTAKLSHVKFSFPSSPVGKNTNDHIRAGVYYGFLETIAGMINRYRKVLGPEMKTVATGGFLTRLPEAIVGIDRLEPDLVLIGLAAIACMLDS